MKRRNKLLLSVVFVVGLLVAVILALPATSSAATETSGTCGDNLMWGYNSSTKTLTISGTGDMYDYESSDDVPWKPYMSNITSVKINDGVTSIGDYAFWWHLFLTKVTIPEGITRIGNSAFGWCPKIQSIAIPESVTAIGANAFYMQGSVSLDIELDEVYIKDIKKWCNISFGNTYSNPLRHATKLYVDGELIKDIVIPAEVTHVPVYAFSCTNLERVTIPSSVTSIGTSAFGGCTGLSVINFDARLENDMTSSNCAFYNAGSTVSGATLNIGAGVSKIPAYLFYSSNIKSAVFEPSSTCKIIGSDAFRGCDNLEKIDIPGSVTSINEYAFNGCTKLTSMTIPDGVISIGERAFSECERLESITIPATVTSIGDEAFYNLYALTEINFNAAVVNDLEYSSHVFYAAGKQSDGITVNIGKDVKKIPAYLFGLLSTDNSPNITGVVFEEGNACKTIGDSAFYGCESLASINLPDSVTSIGDAAFSGCTSLPNIAIPDSVTSIGDSAFSGCTAAKSIVIGSRVKNIGSRAFANCTMLSQITFNATAANNVNSGIFYDAGLYSDGITVYIGDGVTKIPSYLFSAESDGLNAPNISEIKFGMRSACATIGTSAFAYSPVASIILPKSVTGISNNAFYCCDYLQTVNYTGTESQWKSISISSGNDPLLGATVKYGYSDPKYTVTFKNYDGDVISSEEYYIGDTVIAPANPTRVADSVYTYIFTGWDKPIVDCAGDTVYTAVYSSEYIEYTVTFKDYNGNILDSGTYHYGDAVTAPTDPTRAADEVGTHTFSGWDKAVTDCAGNTTYTAVYSTDYIDYTITFKDYDGDIISSNIYHWGDTVAIPDDPTRPGGADCVYVFSGWDQAVSSSCAGNATYTATYSKSYKYEVVFKNYNGDIISRAEYYYGDEVKVPDSPTRSDNTYTYTFAGWDKTVSLTCTGSATYMATYTRSYTEYTVRFLDYNGDVLGTGTYHWGDAVVVPADPVRAEDDTYTYTFAGWDKTVAACAGDATYTAVYTAEHKEYTVIFKDYNGDVISENTYHLIDAVTVPDNPTRDADNIYSYEFSGWDKTVSDVCLGDATYTATYTEKYVEYKIVFKNHVGKVLKSGYYHWGDKVYPPTDLCPPDNDNYMYSYLGWNKPITDCCGDAEYYTKYASRFIGYSVVFQDYDGTVISKERYNWDEEIVVPPDPTREADGECEYVFAGWNTEVKTNCKGNALYIATYDAVKIEDKGISGGAVAGIVGGSVSLVGGGGFALWWFIFRKRRIIG